MYAAYVLVLVLGLRRGEALGLTWNDVTWQGWDEACDEHAERYCVDCRDTYGSSELAVERQLQRVAGTLYHRETKTDASDATLPMPGICATALALRKARQEQDALAIGIAWQASELVFTTHLGTPVEPRNFNRSFHARCAKAGVRRIKVHDARRTCASLLADLDVHPRVVMQILRHAQFSVTMEIYTQVSSRKTREALKRLGDSLDG